MRFWSYKIVGWVGVATLVALVFAGCKKQNDEDLIPAYIQIDTITLNAGQAQGGPYHKITDAWIFVDSEPLGCFELPCKIPVLKSGKHNILVRAGIKINGIGASRIPYPYYQFYAADSVDLVKTQTVTLNPVVTYFPDTQFPYLEDFSSGSTSFLEDVAGDTGLVRLNTAPDLLDGACGAFIMPPGINSAQVYTTSNLILPGGGANVYLEFSFKSNYTLYAGLYINNPGEIVVNQIIGLNPSPDRWNKVYVNLTPEVSSAVNASSFRLFFRVIKTTEDSLVDARILLDNIKIVK